MSKDKKKCPLCGKEMLEHGFAGHVCIGRPKKNTPYIEEFEKEIKSNSYFANQHEGNEFVLKASRAIEIVAEHLTKTIEEERKKVGEEGKDWYFEGDELVIKKGKWVIDRYKKHK